jgi:hypothetical protein
MKAAGYVCLPVFLAVSAYGQMADFSQFDSRGTFELRGHVTSDHPIDFSGMAVELSSFTNRMFRIRSDVARDGSFAFVAIPTGDYLVTVTNMYGDELTSTYTSAGLVSGPVEIRLFSGRQQRPPSGTVSIQSLNHSISRPVRKLLENGTRSLRDQDYEKAATEFREAATKDPQCMQAHANLGAVLIREGHMDDAIGEYSAAISLDPGSARLRADLSAVLASVGKLEDAGTEASAAIRLDPMNARAHLVMAAVLARQNHPIPEIIPHLVAAQDAFADARKSLEKICAAKAWKGCPAR